MFVQAPSNLGQFEACALVSQDFEVLIHQILFWWDPPSATNRPVHIFTPLQNYTPFDVSSSSYFSWLQGPANSQDVGKLGRAFGVGGLGSALQVVVVNGVPITTIGPTWPYVAVGGFGSVGSLATEMWGYQDPPFRLKPFSLCCVQAVNGAVPAGQFLNLNFYYSERVPQGDVG
jgi:hypothetical protein